MSNNSASSTTLDAINNALPSTHRAFSAAWGRWQMRFFRGNDSILLKGAWMDAPPVEGNVVSILGGPSIGPPLHPFIYKGKHRLLMFEMSCLNKIWRLTKGDSPESEKKKALYAAILHYGAFVDEEEDAEAEADG